MDNTDTDTVNTRKENLNRLVSESPWKTKFLGEITLTYCPLDWQKAGKQQTASGYGRKLNTGYKAEFNGKKYRVYCTCFSNSGSCWFIARGQKYFVG